MKLHTKFGSANIDNAMGYYRITSEKEGNKNKSLHRLIFEDFYGFKIPKDYVIHHKNGNKLDNCILNLQMLHKLEHNKLHNSSENHPQYDKIRPIDFKLDLSHDRNNSGIFRVSKKKHSHYARGYYWQYRYYYKGKFKTVCAVTLDKLKEKVTEKGLDWIIIDENKALLTMQTENEEVLT